MVMTNQTETFTLFLLLSRWREVLEKYLPGISSKKKLAKHGLDASDSSTDTADSGPDFLADSGLETALPKPDAAEKPDTETGKSTGQDVPLAPADPTGASPVVNPPKTEMENVEPKPHKVQEKRGSGASSSGAVAVLQSDEVGV